MAFTPDESPGVDDGVPHAFGYELTALRYPRDQPCESRHSTTLNSALPFREVPRPRLMAPTFFGGRHLVICIQVLVRPGVSTL